MKNILIYTGPSCNFCDAAKRLLERNKLKFSEIDVSSGENIRDEMIKKSNGQRTIPQIFFGDRHVGGYSELRALEKENKLKELLE
jgi:Glutaredoxin, GrxC family